MDSSDTILHSRNGGRTLVIMAKAPRTGRIKTRLARSLPAEAVTELYRCLLQDTIALAHALSRVNVAIMCPESDVEDLTRFTEGKTEIVAQQGEGLAAALTSVFTQFAAARKQQVIAFNSDSPHLPPLVVAGAFEVLTEHDVVVGPTYDGGYYLVGAKASHPALFEEDGMGSNSALETLLVRARRLELSVGFTEHFYDIDLQDDLTRLAADLQVAPERAQRTARWLEHWHEAVSQPRTAAGEL